MGHYPQVQPYRTLKFSATETAALGSVGSTSSIYSSTLAVGSLTFAAYEIKKGSILRGHCTITGITGTGGANLVFKWNSTTLYTTTGMSFPADPLRIYWEMQAIDFGATGAFEIWVTYSYSNAMQRSKGSSAGSVNLAEPGTLSVSVINGNWSGTVAGDLPAYVEHLKPYGS